MENLEDKNMVVCDGAPEFISKKEALEALKNSSVQVKGMRLGKVIFVEYSKKLKEGYYDVIRNVPAAKVVPETYGEWVEVGKTNKGTPIRKCSHCGVEKAGRPKSSYCPDCGCCMDLTGSSVIEGQQVFII